MRRLNHIGFALAVVLLIASQQSELDALVAALVVGLVDRRLGHIIHFRP